MKALLFLHSLAITLALSGSAAAGPSESSASDGAVLFLGQLYCEQQQYCPNFAYWGTTPPGYVELTTADGTPSDYLWVDTKGEMTFETSSSEHSSSRGAAVAGQVGRKWNVSGGGPIFHGR